MAACSDFRQLVRETHKRGMRIIIELVINHTSDQHPWFQRARARQARLGRAQFLRLERHRREIQRHADHLHRHREIELDLGPGCRPVLLAPLLLAPARSQFRQSACRARGGQHDAFLARSRRRRVPPRRHSLSLRARGNEQREPSRDAFDHQANPRRARPRLQRKSTARRSQSVARGREGLFRQRR